LRNILAFGSDKTNFFPDEIKDKFRPLDEFELSNLIELTKDKYALILNHHFHNDIVKLIYLIKHLQNYNRIAGNNPHSSYTLLHEIGKAVIQQYDLTNNEILLSEIKKLDFISYTAQLDVINNMAETIVSLDEGMRISQTSPLYNINKLIKKLVNDRS